MGTEVGAAPERWWERVRWLRRNALGLNRRNQDLVLRHNPPRLIGLVDHKTRTKELLAAQGITVPQTYARCTRTRDLMNLEGQIARFAEFVVKPACGAGGEGVLVIAGRDGDRLVKVSGAKLTRRDLLAHAADILGGAFSLSRARDEVLVEQRLRPDASLAPYSPSGVADLRVLLAWGVPLLAMLRLPTHASEGRANLHMGGIGVGMDLVTGVPRYAVCRDQPIEVHPDTQRALCEMRIPHWQDVVRLASRTYDAVPLGYLGVDIVIDDRLGPVILELNARPGLSIQLANRRGLRPLLAALERELAAGRALDADERVQLGMALNESGADEA